MEFDHFFLPGHDVLALPNWNRPRLVLADANISHLLQQRELYPASNLLSKSRRYFLFLLAGFGVLPRRSIKKKSSIFIDFVPKSLGNVAPVAVVVGYQGIAQKFTIKLCDKENKVAGYIKYAVTLQAQQRLMNEYEILATLSSSVNVPKPIKIARLSSGVGLLIAPVSGKSIPYRFELPKKLVSFILNLQREIKFALHDHPWIKEIMQGQSKDYPWIGCLNNREWHLCYLHGDLTPWNVLESKDSVFVIDWENGCEYGFPYIDLIYYLLRIAALVLKMKPFNAVLEARNQFIQEFPYLSTEEILALIKLTALYAYKQRVEEQFPENDFLLNWYFEVIGVNI